MDILTIPPETIREHGVLYSISAKQQKIRQMGGMACLVSTRLCPLQINVRYFQHRRHENDVQQKLGPFHLLWYSLLHPSCCRWSASETCHLSQ